MKHLILRGYGTNIMVVSDFHRTKKKCEGIARLLSFSFEESVEDSAIRQLDYFKPDLVSDF